MDEQSQVSSYYISRPRACKHAGHHCRDPYSCQCSSMGDSNGVTLRANQAVGCSRQPIGYPPPRDHPYMLLLGWRARVCGHMPMLHRRESTGLHAIPHHRRDSSMLCPYGRQHRYEPGSGATTTISPGLALASLSKTLKGSGCYPIRV